MVERWPEKSQMIGERSANICPSDTWPEAHKKTLSHS